MGILVVCAGLTPEESHIFEAVVHNCSPPVEEGCVDPLVGIFAWSCEYVPRFYHCFSRDLSAHSVTDGQAVVKREWQIHGYEVKYARVRRLVAEGREKYFSVVLGFLWLASADPAHDFSMRFCVGWIPLIRPCCRSCIKPGASLE
jgi:hypothetical protein